MWIDCQWTQEKFLRWQKLSKAGLWWRLHSSKITDLFIYKWWILWYRNFTWKYLIKNKRTEARQNSAVLLCVSFFQLWDASFAFTSSYLWPSSTLPSLEFCLVLASQAGDGVSSTAPKWIQRPAKVLWDLTRYSVASPLEGVRRCMEAFMVSVLLWLC